MNTDFSIKRDLVQEIITLIGSDLVFTDLHIEQDAFITVYILLIQTELRYAIAQHTA